MIPPEIIDHVLSFLQRDCATLKVCAQAHRTLSKLVERHLYTHLSVGNSILNSNSDKYSTSDLLKLIHDNPNIAKRVRSLRISVFIRRDNYHELERILPALSQLEAILLSSCTDTVVWDELRESFRTAFTNCLQLPTLTDVKVAGITSFPLSSLNHSSSLKRFSLLGDFLLPSVAPDVFAPMRQCFFSVEMAASWTESRSLSFRSLDFSGDFRLLSHLSGMCGDTLTTLKPSENLL